MILKHLNIKSTLAFMGLTPLLAMAVFADEPADGGPQFIDDCVVGTWSIDHAVMASQFVTVSGAAEATASGSAIMEIEDTGDLYFYLEDFTIHSRTEGQPAVIVVLNGTSENTIDIQEGVFLAGNNDFQITASASIPSMPEIGTLDVPMTADDTAGAGGFMAGSSSGPYTCTDNILTFLPANEADVPMIWHRVEHG